jgi:hypothetical protein
VVVNLLRLVPHAKEAASGGIAPLEAFVLTAEPRLRPRLSKVEDDLLHVRETIFAQEQRTSAMNNRLKDVA